MSDDSDNNKDRNKDKDRDRNKDKAKDKKEYANNVVQFHLKKMKAQVEHPIKTKIKSKLKLVIILTIGIFLFYVMSLSKPLKPVHLSEHKFIANDNGYFTIIIKPNKNSLYVIPGMINKHKTKFILDSGANGISIPQSIAEKASLHKGHAVSASTAGGSIIEYTTKINSLSVNRIQLKSLNATINPSMNLDGVLIGTSILSKFEIIIKNNLMTLRCKIGRDCL